MKPALFVVLAAGGMSLPVFAGTPAPAATPVDNSGPVDVAAMREELAALRRRLDEMEQGMKRETEHEIVPRDQASVKFNEKGFAATSADKNFQLRLRGLVQMEARVFYNDGDGEQSFDRFQLRRARPIMEATLGRDYDIVLVPEFGVDYPDPAYILDAYINAAPFGKGAQLQLGKQRATVGLEMNQSGPQAFFTERALPTQLTSNRDLGVALHGKPAGDILWYKIGLFNGAPDGASPAYDRGTSDGKCLSTVFLVKPWAESSRSELSGLAFGVGADWRNMTGTDVATGLYNYQTDGKQKFYQWAPRSGLDGTTISDGKSYRFTPHAYWYKGPVGLMAEYIVSGNAVSRDFGLTGTTRDVIRNQAWHLGAGWVLTGEKASYKGVVPSSAVNHGGGGAWELVARVTGFITDDDAFSGGYVNPATTARAARSYAVGVNWYLNTNVRFSAAITHTDFDADNPTSDVLINGERALLFRAQLMF